MRNANYSYIVQKIYEYRKILNLYEILSFIGSYDCHQNQVINKDSIFLDKLLTQKKETNYETLFVLW
jgi:hypothetical protein